MDTNTIILLINFILQVLQMFDHSLLKRLRSSKCLCGEITLNDNQEIKKENINDKI